MKKIVLATMMVWASSGMAIEIQIAESTQTKIESKALIKESSEKKEKVKIKDGGVEQTITLPVAQPGKGLVNRSVDENASQSGIMIKFSKKDIDPAQLEAQFGLKVKTKLKSGYYIFENQSTQSDAAIIEEMLGSSYNSTIQTVRPNTKLNMQPR